MVIIQPRIWYVCDKCGEFFYYTNNVPKKCPECKKGILIKKCCFCGNEFKKCKCSKEELNKKCHSCGFLKSKCKCNKIK
ncbi:hypothetical protein K8R47_00555 [archaeon]|nr:hypothetical protein [archaeon]